MIIVGLDWARSKHDYLLMAPTGEILQRGRIPHNTAGLQELAERIETNGFDVFKCQRRCLDDRNHWQQHGRTGGQRRWSVRICSKGAAEGRFGKNHGPTAGGWSLTRTENCMARALETG